MNIKKLKALFLTGVIGLSTVLSACSSDKPADSIVISEEPATLGEIADYLIRAADAYNDKCEREEILADLGAPEEEATRIQALVMVSRAFGELPKPQGNNARLAPEYIDMSKVPEWAREELQNLADGGVLAPSDLGQAEKQDEDMSFGFIQDDSGTTPVLEAEGGDNQAETVTADMPVGEDQDVISEGFGLAAPSDTAEPADSAQVASEPEDVLETKASLKDTATYCKRIYALYGSNLKDDFYQNVNQEELGKQMDSGTGAAFGGSLSLETETDQKVRQLIKNVVNSGESYKFGSDEQKIRDFYLSVVEERTEGLAPLKIWFEKIGQAEDMTGLRNVQIELIKRMGLSNNGLLPFSVSSDLTDSNKTVLNLSSGIMAMTLEEYENKNSPVYREYHNRITENLIKCGEDRETAEELADSIIALEAEEIKHSMNAEEAADLHNYNNIYTMSELSEMFPELGVTEFFTSLGFEDTMTIQCYDPKALKITAQHMNQSELSRLKAQMKLNLLMNNERLLTGQVSEQDALDEVAGYLSTEVGKLYVDRYFAPEAKADIEHMANMLIEIYKKRISNLDWMSEESKKEAKNKLDTLKIYIGYPDEWPENRTEMKAPENGGSYFKNMAAIGREQLRQSVERQNGSSDAFGLSVYMVNAAANRQSNSLVFPAGILQSPFYDPEASFEENLGGIGVIIAHEISHSFDDQGAQYDSTGAVRNWWSQDDYSHFKELCQGVIEFFDGEEPAAGIKMNGQATLSENIADIAGMASAVELLGTTDNPDYDKFFRSYAKSWLLAADRSYVAQMAASDEHAPKKLRVNKVLQNFEEFYRTYKINENDGMYVAPKNRIKIW